MSHGGLHPEPLAEDNCQCEALCVCDPVSYYGIETPNGLFVGTSLAEPMLLARAVEIRDFIEAVTGESYEIVQVPDSFFEEDEDDE